MGGVIERRKMNQITLNGKKYTVAVRNGIRYIHGMRQSDFFDFLESKGDWDAISDLAKLGFAILKEGFKVSPQSFVREQYQSRNN